MNRHSALQQLAKHRHDVPPALTMRNSLADTGRRTSQFLKIRVIMSTAARHLCDRKLRASRKQLVLQRQDGAQYLRNFRRIPGQTEVSMPASLFLQQKRTSAAAYRLPSTVQPQILPTECTGMCDVCQSDSETSHVRLLCCSQCGLMVHNTCYGTQLPELGAAWLCEVCDAGIEPQRVPVCALCPVVGGTMRFTRCGRWVHTVCALWIPGVTLASGRAPCIDMVRSITCGCLAMRALTACAAR